MADALAVVGHVGCFSFYPSKNLGAYGEGGALTTNDDTLAASARLLRDHAQSKKYRARGTGLQLSHGRHTRARYSTSNCADLESWNAARRQVAERYQDLLGDTPLVLPREDVGRQHVWHVYVVRHADRDYLQQTLAEAGIDTGLHYPVPVHLQPAYAHLGYHAGDFPVAEQVARECLSLPLFPELPEKRNKTALCTPCEPRSKEW